MVAIKIGNDVLSVFPTWLLLLLAVELYVGYEVLKKLEMNEQIEDGVKGVREKIDGLAKLIPRYDSKWWNDFVIENRNIEICIDWEV